jgi:putative membrane protein
MPSYVALVLAGLLREAREQHGMNDFAFIQADRERALLIDHIGACERILKTPLPLVYAIKIRRFIALFLLTLPFVLLHKLHSEWLTPVVTMLVAYPLISLDQIGVELQNPFSTANLSHLPLDDIAVTIERNLAGVAKVEVISGNGLKSETSTEGEGRRTSPGTPCVRSCRLRFCGQFVSKLLGAAMEAVQHSLSVTLLIVFDALVHVGFAVLQ